MNNRGYSNTNEIYFELDELATNTQNFSIMVPGHGTKKEDSSTEGNLLFYLEKIRAEQLYIFSNQAQT